jgi:hypothetical protein
MAARGGEMGCLVLRPTSRAIMGLPPTLILLEGVRYMLNARVYVQTMITLASASLGLVAALAWNEAIKTTMKVMLGTDESLAALHTYAILATVLAIVVLSVLSRISSKMGTEAAIAREAEG